MVSLIGEEFEKEENKEFSLKIENLCDQENGFENLVIDDEFREKLINLFEDSAIKKVITMKNKLSLPHKKLFDGFQHFSSIEKIKVGCVYFK